MKEKSAGGVVYRIRKGRAEILLIADRYGKWTLPKGKKESGETDEQTALREIKEETGIDGMIIEKIDHVKYRYMHPERGMVDKGVVYYLVEASKGKEVPQLEEIDGLGWYAPEDALQLQREKGYDNNDIILNLALARIEQIVKGRSQMDVKQIAAMIDHTLLKPEATNEQIAVLCEEAKRHGFASVCVNPYWVKEAARHLAGTDVKVCTVVGFPLGATTKEAKAYETRDAIQNGATEIDMVMNIGALKSGDLATVKEDIQAVVEAAQGLTVKVILETGLLTDDEIVQACEQAKRAGARFVKTSTGFGQGGATVEAVELMRKTVGPEMGVKASGGIRDLKTVRQMIAAGADRIGASASVAIVTGGSGMGTY